MTLEQTISAIRPLDEKSMTAARNRFANIAMPLGGLGLLQDAIVQLAGILGQPVPDISRRVAGWERWKPRWNPPPPSPGARRWISPSVPSSSSARTTAWSPRA